MSVLSALKAAKRLISSPGTWTTGRLKRDTDCGEAYCALGALLFTDDGKEYYTARAAVANLLFRRFDQGKLPTATAGPGNQSPTGWNILMGRRDEERMIAQFNNSTSQEEVLKLFDEAIAVAERDEGYIPEAVPAPTEPVKQEPKPEPVKVPERVLELV